MSSYDPIGREIPLDGTLGETPIEVAIGSSSTQVIPADDDTILVNVSNIGNKDMFITMGNTAQSNKGIFIAKGDSKILPLSAGIKQQINGISTGAGTQVSVQVWK